MADSDALTRLSDWLDDRTGYRAARSFLHDRLLTGGPRWSYATGACSLGLFALVAVTGLLLMTSYSPASDHGWSSVFYIESTPGGSFVRGLHFYGSHALLILFAIHLARAILTASYRAPRELSWISGLLLFLLLVAAAVTGNPLSASNKAFSQIEVESHIIGSMPLIGPLARNVLVGGSEIGHLTMTRLYTLHVAVLPTLAGLLLLFHLYQQLRWGTVPAAAGTTVMPEATSVHQTDAHNVYWPDQTSRNALVFGVTFGLVAFLAWRYGAPLDAPADSTIDEIARPEWYFRALFELRSYFSGGAEFVITGVLPAVFLGFLALLPWIDRLLPPLVSHIFRCAIVLLGAAGWVGLTAVSFARDREDSVYAQYVDEARSRSERARLLASAQRIPPEGPAALLRNDPKMQGPILFARHCANCHSHLDDEGNGIAATTPAASNLYGFANREWIAGLLDPEQIAGPNYYGHTAFADDEEPTSMGMIDYVRDELFAVEDDELPARKEQVRKLVAALSAEAHLPSQAEMDKADAADIAEGRELLAGDEIGCMNCHKFYETGDLGLAPDLTGYGSRNWLAGIIAAPTHERFYDGNNDGMPAFMPAESGSPENILSRNDLLLIVDWLRGDWIGR